MLVGCLNWNHQNNMAAFRKVNLGIKRGMGYGQYVIFARYRGKELEAHTTDSECFDWLNDDSNKKLHRAAKRHAYYKIVKAYENRILYL